MDIARRTLLGAGMTAAAWRPVWAAAPEAESAAAAIDAAALVAIQAGACPGIEIAIWRAGRPLLSKGYGRADIGTGDAVSAASVFRIGSLTKQFTAALVVKLAAEGRLGLDDPVSKYLPAFAKLDALSLRELMNHTAGLHSDETDASPPTPAAGPRSQVALAAEIAAQARPFDFPPGTAWFYSNANYIVLGAVVEQVTGRPLAQAAEAMMFKPLGLGRTAFDRTGAAVKGRVQGYTPIEGAAPGFTPAAFLEISETGGAGAMRSTAEDLCRWHHALLGGRLFGAEWVRAMLAPGRLRDGRISGANRFSAEDAVYGEVQYGLGLLLSPPGEAPRTISHYGYINGFSAYLETYVDLGLSTAILCNADVGPAMPFRAVRRIVAARLAAG